MCAFNNFLVRTLICHVLSLNLGDRTFTPSVNYPWLSVYWDFVYLLSIKCSLFVIWQNMFMRSQIPDCGTKYDNRWSTQIYKSWFLLYVKDLVFRFWKILLWASFILTYIGAGTLQSSYCWTTLWKWWNHLTVVNYLIT